MKFLRLFCLSAAVCGLSVAAYGDEIPDFNAHVLDPPVAQGSIIQYPINEIDGTSFTVTFTACQPGELPGGITAQGCFAGENVSGVAWTSLDMAFGDDAALNGQPVTCGTGPFSFFGSTDCSLDPTTDTYLLGFDNGVIPSDQGAASIFYITEDGVPPALFPPGDAVAGVATPEPGTWVLLLTGTVMVGLFCSSRFRLLARS